MQNAETSSVYDEIDDDDGDDQGGDNDGDDGVDDDEDDDGDAEEDDRAKDCRARATDAASLVLLVPPELRATVVAAEIFLLAGARDCPIIFNTSPKLVPIEWSISMPSPSDGIFID